MSTTAVAPNAKFGGSFHSAFPESESLVSHFGIPDLGLVKQFLATHLGTIEDSISDLEVKQMKVTPEGKLRLLYSIEQNQCGVDTKYFFAAHVPRWNGKKCEETINREFASMCRDGRFENRQKHAIYSEDLGLLFQIFPVDRRLPNLVRAADPGFMMSKFKELFPTQANDWRMGLDDIDLIQYKPERKALFRYKLPWGEGEQVEGSGQFFYGRVSRKPVDPAFTRLMKIQDALRGTVFHAPRPLAALPEFRIFFMDELPGKALSMLCPDQGYQDLCGRTAQGLWEFHNLPISLAERKDVDVHISEALRWGKDFARRHPEKGGKILNSIRRIVKDLAKHPPCTPKLAHGDFHVANILFSAKGLGLLDFEDCYMGNPAADVGFFYAQLKLLALKLSGDRSSLDDSVAEFLSVYMRICAPEYRSPISTYCALNCLWCAYFQCFLRPLRRGWKHQMIAMMNQCEEILRTGNP